MKTWKRRWFILTDSCLYYFEFTTVSRGLLSLTLPHPEPPSRLPVSTGLRELGASLRSLSPPAHPFHRWENSCKEEEGLGQGPRQSWTLKWSLLSARALLMLPPCPIQGWAVWEDGCTPLRVWGAPRVHSLPSTSRLLLLIVTSPSCSPAGQGATGNHTPGEPLSAEGG